MGRGHKHDQDELAVQRKMLLSKKVLRSEKKLLQLCHTNKRLTEHNKTLLTLVIRELTYVEIHIQDLKNEYIQVRSQRAAKDKTTDKITITFSRMFLSNSHL
mgnify:FL=1